MRSINLIFSTAYTTFSKLFCEISNYGMLKNKLHKSPTEKKKYKNYNDKTQLTTFTIYWQYVSPN